MSDPGSRSPSRMVGILGGMGPAATADFYAKLIAATPARVDQDHVRVVMWADPTVPSRQDALIGRAADPTPWLERGVTELMRCGAEIIVVPCNTVHAYLPNVLDGKDVEFISIIESAVEATCRADPGSHVGLLATDGALSSGLYQRELRRAGREPILPSAEAQAAVMRSVHAIKAGSPPTDEQPPVRVVVDELRAAGVTSLIVGCTELSLVLTDLEVGIPAIDPSRELAVRTVERSLTR